MGKDGDQAEGSKIQRTTRVRLPFAETSLPRSLCPEMCMICKRKDLKVKHSRQLQQKLLPEPVKKTLKEAAFARNDKEMIISVSETYLIANQFQEHKKCYLDYIRNVRKSSSAAISTSEEICLGHRAYNSVLSLIDDDVFASQQCLSMETITMEYNGSIGTKQSRIRLMVQRLNSYGGRLLFLQAGYHTQQAVISKECLHTNVF